MRDVQGFLAYLLTGPHTCEDFKAGTEGHWFWENAFVGGQGLLFDAVRRYDPRQVTTPLLDDRLWRGADNPNDWFVPPASQRGAKDTLNELTDIFVSKKRRALFEHKMGDLLLRASSYGARPNDGRGDATWSDRRSLRGASFESVLRPERQGVGRLHFWTTHRFDAQNDRYAASFINVPLNEFELAVPKLRRELWSAFPNFYPPYSVLRLKSLPVSTGLRIDRELLRTLVSAEQGLPMPFRRGEPEARVAAFFDRMVKERGASNEELLEVRAVDMDSGSTLRVAINVRVAAYVRM